jgi:MFS transporter, AAHS family, 4-hydroxybenzoate transporter
MQPHSRQANSWSRAAPLLAGMATGRVQSEIPRFRVMVLCGLVLFLDGYDISAVGYAIPSLTDSWKVAPQAFTGTLAGGNFGLLLGSLCAGLLGDRFGRKPVLIGSIAAFGLFSLLSAFAASPSQLAGLRFLTGLGLGGGIPVAIALVADFAPQIAPGRLVMLTSVGVPIGFALGGLAASQPVTIFGWPAIFVAGGTGPLVMAPLLALWLPESIASRARRRDRSAVAALFWDGLAPITLLLWAVNFLSLLGVYFILLWTPALLHHAGASPSQAIFATTMYASSVIAGGLLMASIVDRVGMERVLACGLAFGACCVFLIGALAPPFWLLTLMLCGAGFGGGSQGGINALSGLAYPPAMRATGTGWALGAGRGGATLGPVLAGVLLALGFRGQDIFVAASVPALCSALLMAALGGLRRAVADPAG